MNQDLLYNKQYYQRIFSGGSFLNKVKTKNFGDVPERLVAFLKLSKKDTVIDYGCGEGNLSLLLNLRYGCRVIGLDVSKNAIFLANKNKKKSKAKNVKFLIWKKTHASLFKNIKAVYFEDVLEHMTDEQIKEIITLIKKWNKEVKIVIHTDNNFYLKYLCPFFNFFQILINPSLRTIFEEREAYDRQRHINLTTAPELKRKLEKMGFSVKKIKYSKLSLQKIKSHLDLSGNRFYLTFLIFPAYLFLKIFPFLRPSFFLVAQLEKKEKNV